jgi:hypothetical protein
MIWLLSIFCAWLYLVGCVLMRLWGDDNLGRDFKWSDYWSVAAWPALIPWAIGSAIIEEVVENVRVNTTTMTRTILGGFCIVVIGYGIGTIIDKAINIYTSCCVIHLH